VSCLGYKAHFSEATEPRTAPAASWCGKITQENLSQGSRRVAIADYRLELTAILRRDVHYNSCSHNESLNRFGHFGNRPYESDH
jgi:hypothetical protein